MIHIIHLEKLRILGDMVQQLLQQHSILHRVSTCARVDEILSLLSRYPIDLLLIDVEACEDCIDFCTFMKNEYPDVKVILHTNFWHPRWLEQLIKESVQGFVSRQAGWNELLGAIQQVSNGQFFLSPEIRNDYKNVSAFISGHAKRLRPVKSGLTFREAEIIQRLAMGYSNKQIAMLLGVGEKTIESHRKNIIRKAGVKNTAELMVKAAARGMIYY